LLGTEVLVYTSLHCALRGLGRQFYGRYSGTIFKWFGDVVYYATQVPVLAGNGPFASSEDRLVRCYYRRAAVPSTKVVYNVHSFTDKSHARALIYTRRVKT